MAGRCNRKMSLLVRDTRGTFWDGGQGRGVNKRASTGWMCKGPVCVQLWTVRTEMALSGDSSVFASLPGSQTEG